MSGAISENVECPNCKEKVPKTLYCLSCGYPIYKMDEAETPSTEIKADTLDSHQAEEPIKSVETDDVKPEEISVETKVDELGSVQPEQMIDTAPEEVSNVEEPEKNESIQ
jgi:hypothetical protein